MQKPRRGPLLLDPSRLVGEGYPLRRYARLVGAPNSAPSLCSVAGLLLALALESAYEDTPRLLEPRSVTARASECRARRRVCAHASAALRAAAVTISVGRR